jgi:RNA polymerase sigma factor (sigma-70 family)
VERNDAELVRACREGNVDAWEELVQRYQRLVYAIPRRAGLSDEGAADVFQRTFLQLVQNLDAIDQPDRVGAWLVTTARREAWRISRSERAAISLSDLADDASDQVSEVHDEALLPDELMIQMEQQHMVRTALGKIGADCRKLIELLFYQPERLTYSEIARVLKISEGSIGPTRARCLQKLRRQLNGVLW